MACKDGCDKNGGLDACNLSVAAMLVGSGLSWPPELDVPPPGVPTTQESAAGETSSNCLFGPTNETLCTRRVRQLQRKTEVVGLTGIIGLVQDIAFSPASYGSAPNTLLATIPTHDLTACVRLMEVRVTLQRGGAYVIGSATGGVAVGTANARSAWWASENNVALGTSTATGPQLGARLVSTDGRCECDSLRAWGTFDLGPQIEFTLPGAFSPIPDDVVTISFVVERTYLAARACKLPARCGQPVWSGPVAEV